MNTRVADVEYLTAATRYVLGPTVKRLMTLAMNCMLVLQLVGRMLEL